MDNPVLDSEQAAKAFLVARTTAKDRFDVWDKTVIYNLSRTEAPSAWAARLLAQNKADDIAFLKTIIPPNRWKAFERYAGGRILDDPTLLTSLDRETLGQIFNPSELKMLGGIVDDLATLRADKFGDLMKQGYKNRGLIRQHLNNASPAEAEAFLKGVIGDPKAMTDVKAALVDDAMEAALGTGERGVHKVLSAKIAEWKDNGLIRMFDFKEKRALAGLVDYLKYAETGIDVGTRLITAGMVSRLKDYSTTAVVQIVHTIGIGRLLMTHPMQNFLLGRGGQAVNLGAVRAFAAAAVASTDTLSGTSENAPQE